MTMPPPPPPPDAPAPEPAVAPPAEAAAPEPPPPPQALPPQLAPVLGRGWLRSLMRGIRRDGLQARDPRVKALWDRLRSRQLLARSPWLRARLRYFWQSGLVMRHRPRTTQQIVALLRSWGFLRPRVSPLPFQARRVIIRRPYGRPYGRPLRRLRPVILRRVATVRPVGRGAARPRGGWGRGGGGGGRRR